MLLNNTGQVAVAYLLMKLAPLIGRQRTIKHPTESDRRRLAAMCDAQQWLRGLQDGPYTPNSGREAPRHWFH